LIKPDYKFPDIDPKIKKKRDKNAKKQSILIIDEVDVFFSDSFYGKTFNPVSPFTVT
jgi:hypothetical protein